MRIFNSAVIALGIFAIGFRTIGSLAAAPHRPAAPLRFVQAIPLPGVEGRIDHFSLDSVGQRLFVAALGNNTVEVIDLRAGRRLRSIRGFHEPQGVAWLPDFGMLAVANGQGGGLALLDGVTFAVRHRIEPLDDADNVRYDPAARRVYVGFGSGAICAIDPATGRKTGEIALPAHPESFQLTRGGRAWVNLPGARSIAEIDLHSLKVIREVPLAGASANFPMTLDEADRRVFAGFRRPPVVAIVDMRTGKTERRLEIGGDTDDLFWDAGRRRLILSCGEGRVDVYRESSPGAWELQTVATAPGARTSLFVPELSRLYVAVPHRGAQRAEIRVFDSTGGTKP